MKTKREEKEDVITISLIGRLDKVSSPEFDEELKKESDKNKNIVLDFKDLEYISSAGLRVLIACEKKLKTINKNMEIINVTNDVMDIMKVTGFIYMLNIKK